MPERRQRSYKSIWWAQVDSNHRPHAYQACALTTWAMSPFWWRWTGSNRWPPACKAGALPAELHPHMCWHSSSPSLTVPFGCIWSLLRQNAREYTKYSFRFFLAVFKIHLKSNSFSKNLTTVWGFFLSNSFSMDLPTVWGFFLAVLFSTVWGSFLSFCFFFSLF